MWPKSLPCERWNFRKGVSLLRVSHNVQLSRMKQSTMDEAAENRYDALHRQSRWSSRLRSWLEHWLDQPTPADLRDLLDRLERSERARKSELGQGSKG